MNGRVTAGKRSFLTGAALLAAAAVLIKILGAVYRIPLTARVGAGEMGLYSAAFHIYAVAAALTSTGIPAAEATLIARRLARGDARGARAVFYCARRVMALLGAALAVLTFFFSDALSGWTNNPDAALAVRMAAPAVFLGALIEAYRGLFRGRGRMAPIAASQLVEQCVRTAAGLYFAKRLLSVGTGGGAAGALLGASVSQAAGLLAVVIAAAPIARDRTVGTVRSGCDARLLVKMALPVTAGACVMPLAGVLEAAMLYPRLALSGVASAEAVRLYGVYTGVVGVIATLPQLLAGTLAMSLLPAIAACRGAAMQKRVRQGMAATLTIACAVSIGIVAAAQPLVSTLYPTLGAAETAAALDMLRLSMLSAVPASLNIAAAGALHGLGRMREPARALAAAAAVKIAAEYVLLAVPGVGVRALSLSTFLCVLCACLLDLRHLRQACGARPLEPSLFFSAAAPAAVFCAGAVFLQSRLQYGKLTQIAVAALFCAVYLIALFACGALGGVFGGEGAAARILGGQYGQTYRRGAGAGRSGAFDR